MEGIYGSGKYCPGEPEARAGTPGSGSKDDCLDLDQLSDILRTSTDPAKLLDAWRGWHTISPPLRPLFQKYVELGNKGARELGFADMGAMWRSKYDMPRRRFPGRDGQAVGAGEAAVSFTARLRALEAAGEIRRPGSGQRSHPRASAGQHVGAGMGEHLSAGCAEGRRSRLRFDGHSEGPGNAAAGHGEVRRALFHFAGIRAAAENVLGALACS